MRKRYVTTGEAAGDLGMSAAKLLRLMDEGQVTAARRTREGDYRWDLDDVLRQLGNSPATTGEPQSGGSTGP
jgi:hypothetical protein